jgi:hypothetical protein
VRVFLFLVFFFFAGEDMRRGRAADGPSKTCGLRQYAEGAGGHWVAPAISGPPRVAKA